MHVHTYMGGLNTCTSPHPHLYSRPLGPLSGRMDAKDCDTWSCPLTSPCALTLTVACVHSCTHTHTNDNPLHRVVYGM